MVSQASIQFYALRTRQRNRLAVSRNAVPKLLGKRQPLLEPKSI
jgi:hypothetical protein